MILTAETVKTLSIPTGKTECLIFDEITKGFGLRLRQAGDGSVRKGFFVQYRTEDGKQQRRRKLKAKTLDAARKEATALMAKVEDGKDPAAERDAERNVLAFDEAVTSYLQVKAMTLRPSSLRATKLFLTGPAYFGKIHKLQLTKITKAHISHAIDQITVKSSAVSARQARRHLNAFFSWCLQGGLCDLNPVVGSRKPEGGSSRERVLSDAELQRLWHESGDDDFGKIVKLLMLTACRRSEIGGLLWSEIDMAAGAFTIPGARVKNGHSHTLPLSPLALDIIKSVPQRAGRDHLFGDRSTTGFCDFGREKPKLDKRLGFSHWTLHDIRRSVATHMADDLDTDPHVIDGVLNHYKADVYNRAKYGKQIARAVLAWSDRLDALVNDKQPDNLLAFPATA